MSSPFPGSNCAVLFVQIGLTTVVAKPGAVSSSNPATDPSTAVLLICFPLSNCRLRATNYAAGPLDYGPAMSRSLAVLGDVSGPMIQDLRVQHGSRTYRVSSPKNIGQ
jgi:hypothetical protein